MKIVKIALTSVILIGLSAGKSYARPVVSGDIVGRDLIIFGLGWAGHVAMVTGDNVGQSSSLLIEAMKDGQPWAIVLNNLGLFKKQSKYWGSRYGIGDYANGTRAALVEVNHQRWWCPSYTSSTAYKIGQGVPTTGQIISCGEWRCDTLVAWSFYSAGYPQLINNRIILPTTIFNTFPFQNNGLLEDENTIKPPLLLQSDKVFSDLSANELNAMPYEEFELIADIPMNLETPTHIESEWRYANDSHINDIKRGIFIDRLSMSNEPNVIPNFIKMYDETKEPEIKRKLIIGTVIYYQNHNDQVALSQDKELLRVFYKKLLNEQLAIDSSDMAMRGFIHFYSSKEIIENRKLIDKQFKGMDRRSLLSLKLELSHKSKELETIYFPSIIDMLKKNNSSDLNEMFFGLTKMGWRHLHNKESVDLIKNYVQFSSYKYENKALNDYNDPYFNAAKQTYIELKNDL
jgi:hypothetical protein